MSAGFGLLLQRGSPRSSTKVCCVRKELLFGGRHPARIKAFLTCRLSVFLSEDQRGGSLLNGCVPTLRSFLLHRASTCFIPLALHIGLHSHWRVACLFSLLPVNHTSSEPCPMPVFLGVMHYCYTFAPLIIAQSATDVESQSM